MQSSGIIADGLKKTVDRTQICFPISPERFAMAGTRDDQKLFQRIWGLLEHLLRQSRRHAPVGRPSDEHDGNVEITNDSLKITLVGFVTDSTSRDRNGEFCDWEPGSM